MSFDEVPEALGVETMHFMRGEEPSMSHLVWTSEKPKAAGWYWWRGLGEDMDPLILLVDEVGYFQWPDGGSQEVGLTKGEWAGPITPPEDH